MVESIFSTKKIGNKMYYKCPLYLEEINKSLYSYETFTSLFHPFHIYYYKIFKILATLFNLISFFPLILLHVQNLLEKRIVELQYTIECSFNFGNSRQSLGAKSGDYGGCSTGSKVTLYLTFQFLYPRFVHDSGVSLFIGASNIGLNLLPFLP